MFQISAYGKTSGIKLIAKNGVLDLKTWNIQTRGPVALEGEWAFYWNQLLIPSDFEKDLQPQISAYVPVPKYWNDYNIGSRF